MLCPYEEAEPQFIQASAFGPLPGWPNPALYLWGLGRRPLFGITQDPRLRMGSSCSPKGRQSFPHPSLSHCASFLCPGLTGCAIPPSAASGFCSQGEKGLGMSEGLWVCSLLFLQGSKAGNSYMRSIQEM